MSFLKYRLLCIQDVNKTSDNLSESDKIKIRKLKKELPKSLNYAIESSLNPKYIVLSPGPCTPNEAGISLDVVRELKGKVPILGVCLGHQTIGQALGGKITHAKTIMHGKTSEIHHLNKGVFKYPTLKRVTAKSGQRQYTGDDNNPVPSVTTILSDTGDKTALIAWRKRVGEAEATRISTESAGLGTKVHNALEKFILQEDYEIKGNFLGNLKEKRDVAINLDNITMEDVLILTAIKETILSGSSSKDLSTAFL